MATTSLKLSDNLRSTVALIAQEEGVTPHAFMVEAISRAAVLATQRQQLIAEARAGAAHAAERTFMATKIRLKRGGRKGKPYYRIVVQDSRNRSRGRRRVGAGGQERELAAVLAAHARVRAVHQRGLDAVALRQRRADAARQRLAVLGR
jgi:predicted transcriptional regulator